MPDSDYRQTWDSLESIASDVRSCTLCSLSDTRTNAVPGEGSSFAAVMLIGEGPGFNEDQQGRPFVGSAGKLLDDLLSAAPLKREDVYITNVVKCRPPNNRDPQPGEVKACKPFLEAQIELINPRVIATLGRHSLMRFFPEARISRCHGQIMRWQGRILMPLYHPAAALRSSQVMEATLQDFRRIPEALLASLALASSEEVEPAPESPPEAAPAPAGQPQAATDPPQDEPLAEPEQDGSGERQQLSMF